MSENTSKDIGRKTKEGLRWAQAANSSDMNRSLLCIHIASDLRDNILSSCGHMEFGQELVGTRESIIIIMYIKTKSDTIGMLSYMPGI